MMLQEFTSAVNDFQLQGQRAGREEFRGNNNTKKIFVSVEVLIHSSMNFIV